MPGRWTNPAHGLDQFPGCFPFISLQGKFLLHPLLLSESSGALRKAGDEPQCTDVGGISCQCWRCTAPPTCTRCRFELCFSEWWLLIFPSLCPSYLQPGFDLIAGAHVSLSVTQGSCTPCQFHCTEQTLLVLSQALSCRTRRHLEVHFLHSLSRCFFPPSFYVVCATYFRM